MRRSTVLAWVGLLVWLGVLAGCQCGTGSPTGSAAGSPDEAPVSEINAAIPMGTIEGIVRLAADSEPPRYPENPVAGTGPRALPEDCSAATSADMEPLRMATDRGLSFVPVIGLGDEENWPERPASPRTIDVHIRDCRLDPPVITATRGDLLAVHNELVYPFFPVLGAGGGFTQAVLPGEARVFELDAPRPATLQCSTTAPCGRTEVLVLGSPVHTVSGEAGHFRISVPADQDVELVAWHPLLLEASTHVTVAPGETAHVEIDVRAVPAPAAPEPSSVPEGELPEDHPELGPF